jgi:hypothetical protein
MFLTNEYLLQEGLVRAISHLVSRRLSMSVLLNFFSEIEWLLPRSLAVESGKMFANGYKISV